MILLLNGSFGVGKSTVAELLRTTLPDSRIYDPEIVGSILMRLPRWIKLRGSRTDDFQDIDLWRKSVAWGIRLTKTWTRGVVIVPMTFDRCDYLQQISSEIRRFEPNLHIICLRASLPTIRHRLIARGTALEGPGSEWITRRIAECSSAHQDPFFGIQIDTENLSSPEVTAKILSILQNNKAITNQKE